MNEQRPTSPVGKDATGAPQATPADASRAWRASVGDVLKAFVPLLVSAAGFALFLTLALNVSHWAWVTLHSIFAAMWFLALLVALAIALFTLAETVPVLRVRTQRIRQRIAHRNTTIARILGWSEPDLPQSIAVRSAILDQYAANDADEAELRHYEQTLRDADAQHDGAQPAPPDPNSSVTPQGPAAARQGSHPPHLPAAHPGSDAAGHPN